MKNGNTTNAGATYTGVAQRDSRTLLVTVMNPAKGHNEVYREAARAAGLGLQGRAGTVKPVGTLVPPLSQVHTRRRPRRAEPAARPRRADDAAAGTRVVVLARGLWTAAGITGRRWCCGVITVVRRRRLLPGAPRSTAAGRGAADAAGGRRPLDPVGPVRPPGWSAPPSLCALGCSRCADRCAKRGLRRGPGGAVQQQLRHEVDPQQQRDGHAEGAVDALRRDAAAGSR